MPASFTARKHSPLLLQYGVFPDSGAMMLGRLALVSGLLLALLCVPAAVAGPEQTSLPVFVSILPQKYFVEQVGGTHVEVSVLVGPGHSPATYEPTPGQMQALGQARLFVRIGVPFEDVWYPRIRETNPDMITLDAREDIPLRTMQGAHGVSLNLHQGHGKDPHIWTSPPLVKVMARHLRDRLSALDPMHAADYAQNFAGFSADLDALDQDIRDELAGLRSRRFMVFHPAWGYFADTYNLEQIPVEAEGKSPGPRTLALLIEQAKAENIRVLFVQEQFSQKAARTIARAIQGRVESVDALAYDYPQNLRRVTRLIAEANR
jgi:zinc transport system substrate-binding protein